MSLFVKCAQKISPHRTCFRLARWTLKGKNYCTPHYRKLGGVVTATSKMPVPQVEDATLRAEAIRAAAFDRIAVMLSQGGRDEKILAGIRIVVESANKVLAA